MTPSGIFRMLWSIAALLTVALGLGTAWPVAAQIPPPGQGTIALEGTMKTLYRAANVFIVTTVDGVEHVYHFAKDLVVHGGRGPGVEALEGLREGSTVVVHYSVQGAEQDVREVDVIGEEGLAVTEGMVARVDQRRGQITVRYANGKTEVFQLTERAIAESLPTVDQTAPGETKVMIYYSDEDGRKVAHYFRRVSK